MLAVRIEPELYEALDLAAAEHAVTRSQLVREALAEVVDPQAVEAGRQHHLVTTIREGFEGDLVALRHRLLADPRQPETTSAISECVRPRTP